MEYPTSNFLLFFTSFCSAGLCFWGAKLILKRAEKHARFTSLDRNLPLQGRWLRYEIAALLTIIGVFSSMISFFVFHHSNHGGSIASHHASPHRH